jgi:hypothetical protein
LQFLPTGGAVTHFYVRLSDPPGQGSSYEVRLQDSFGDTTLRCTVSDNDTVCWDRSNCAEYAAVSNEGKPDLIYVAVNPSGSPEEVTMHWTAVFYPNAQCPNQN